MSERVQLGDTMQDMFVKLSAGNPGALGVLLETWKQSHLIDPDGDPLLSLLRFDSLGIYGERIWLLYKYVCGQSLNKTLACTRAWQLGLVSKNKIDHAIDHHGDGFDIIDVCAKVLGKLPQFNLGEPS